MDYCPVTDFYYKQCQFSSLPLGIIALLVFLVLLCLVLLGFCYLCCCCTFCCVSGDADEEEHQALLNDRSKYLRRSSTYYQWNRTPLTSTTPFQHQTHNHPSNPTYAATTASHSGHPPTANHIQPSIPPNATSRPTLDSPTSPSFPIFAANDSWETRRSNLLKKYARDPVVPTTSPSS
ncbi:hypothetical protein DM01DRAFT_1382828 [Hesseltinella vesiculosa]|uniref:Uncharacterized protein n=1 Tax=Hesseltinella vesiculosa TaxID=101127 RepID=A0A1X2GK90_9FUNG|nr:hypothetical protein DM01DRAFT_1382828 [Hesseltinella vesiculosa]